jgi:hypothetical protein
MMAIRRFFPRTAKVLAVMAPLLAAMSCSDERIIPQPKQSVVPPVTVRPPAHVAHRSPSTDWRDRPITPGDWRWSMEGSRSVARFGGPDPAMALVLSCNRDAAAVTLIRAGAGEGQVPMTVIASSVTRPLNASAIAGPPPVIAVTLSARDSLLDAMAFSRGRFAVETAGLPTLYVPSWPEVSRVVEDCR